MSLVVGGSHARSPPDPVHPAPVFLPVGGGFHPPPLRCPIGCVVRPSPPIFSIGQASHSLRSGLEPGQLGRVRQAQKAPWNRPTGLSGRPSCPGGATAATMAEGVKALRVLSAVPLSRPPSAPPLPPRSAPDASNGGVIAPSVPSLSLAHCHCALSAPSPCVVCVATTVPSMLPARVLRPPCCRSLVFCPPHLPRRHVTCRHSPPSLTFRPRPPSKTHCLRWWIRCWQRFRCLNSRP